ncbi:MAG: SDR family NAD(P)-dependent oxidoreductase [Candidatus Pelagibacterales bacterium]
MKKNRISVVTGASANLGRSVSIELAKSSKHIYLIGRNIKELEKTADFVERENCETTVVPIDLTNFKLIDELGHSIYKRHKKIDVFISCAGTIKHLSPLTSIKPLDFEEIINLNLIANFRILRSFHPLFLSSNNARILIISKNILNLGNQYWGSYNSIMLALNNLIKTYANENRTTNFKINLFEPPLIESNFVNMTSPGENKKNMREIDLVASKILHYVNEDFTETGQIFNFS